MVKSRQTFPVWCKLEHVPYFFHLKTLQWESRGMINIVKVQGVFVGWLALVFVLPFFLDPAFSPATPPPFLLLQGFENGREMGDVTKLNRFYILGYGKLLHLHCYFIFEWTLRTLPIFPLQFPGHASTDWQPTFSLSSPYLSVYRMLDISHSKGNFDPPVWLLDHSSFQKDSSLSQLAWLSG